MMMVARPLTYGVFIALAGAFACLVLAFIVNDFTVTYVVNNSNSHLPLYYRIAATWGARGIASVVGPDTQHLDAGGGYGASISGNGDDCLRLPGVYFANLQPFSPHAAWLSH